MRPSTDAAPCEIGGDGEGDGDRLALAVRRDLAIDGAGQHVRHQQRRHQRDVVAVVRDEPAAFGRDQHISAVADGSELDAVGS